MSLKTAGVWVALAILILSGRAMAQNAPGELTGAIHTLPLTSDGKDFDLTYVIPNDNIWEKSYAIVEGDIIIGAAEDMPKPDEQKTLASLSDVQLFGLFIIGKNYLWPNGVVPYRIDPDLPRQDRVLDAIKHWESKTKIRFVAAKADTKDLIVFKHAAPDNCSSSVGRVGGAQPIHVGDQCSKGNMIHEIGHALGLTHEHMRKDRDQFVEFMKDNVDKDLRYNFNQNPLVYADQGSYCYESIMHYRYNAFAINPLKPTLKPRKAGVFIGQRDGLAACDIATIAAKYGG